MKKHFENINVKSYFKFVLPTIFSMLFISVYSMTDGIFISNRLGSSALASLNITLPASNFIFGSVFMVVIGASAIIGINIGAKKIKEANENFSNMIYILAGLVFIYLIIGLFFAEDIAELLGAKGELLPLATDYLTVILLGSIGFVIKFFTEVFLRLEGKFNLSMFATIIGGVANVGFNYVFMYIFDMGMTGAALGTIFGAFINGIIGVLYFCLNYSSLKFRFVKIDTKFIKSSLANGSSEMVSSLSTGITTFIFNTVLLKLVGKIGVSSISIVLYANFFLSSIFIGLSMGIQPLLSYNFGAEKIGNIKKLLKISIITIGSISLVSFTICNIFKYHLIHLFERTNLDLIMMTGRAFTICSFAFFVNGFNILGSAFFTSINNGKYSAIISFSRSLIFKMILVLLLPKILGLNGVWMTMPLSEYLCIIMTMYFYKKCKKRYSL
ncbi:MATE family efflux transporter [Clostridiaceae bacterium M8S5]|nr:MATE family efflux transporter [Clostridiaceae bacterium M8S5]